MSEVLTPAELVQGPAVSTGDVREGVRAGLDLRDPVVYGQVRRIFLARWARVAAAEGCDVDDLLQEVYRSILARNAGTHPFRPRQGDEGRSNYIFMVCRSVTSNAIEKARRCSIT
jgi:hypothetical protein